jgi:hypothetical protein
MLPPELGYVSYAELRIANVCINEVVSEERCLSYSDADPFLPTESVVT